MTDMPTYRLTYELEIEADNEEEAHGTANAHAEEMLAGDGYLDWECKMIKR